MISIRLFIPILVQVRISSGVRIARSDCCVFSFFVDYCLSLCPFVLWPLGCLPLLLPLWYHHDIFEKKYGR